MITRNERKAFILWLVGVVSLLGVMAIAWLWPNNPIMLYGFTGFGGLMMLMSLGILIRRGVVKKQSIQK
ncbi:MAG: hypothetical protein A3B74_01375 [Candidatus Kerfeldbacteria bacterium RIFCSPHIGHO2_02_FULL_42_14]|uniref:Uncharacterized protein n=1 Tax=Candidatus Kerfeldbacteria bacterium RIFCSPHIGHO2_02_FULL_42_14 TaxID=1798540 RepID=A0A1G2ASV9_9BACT|nr:MAG: hypothetical protein A3B74_01375 [Candidatus Kerfeldbacteria bacterium RIFCSPHIGHO2_02_FULL_42_14]OGY81210.1 MAG: hypothetical protein A3E60_02890 [Candidatus Kerfeldbacteria bacterium RIFCSPHIGHO2_12_FULL_42_13]OGY83370.1 MAG: hypothetical protein A3I91_01820 [Candidatus Kerfeldbacteria bacterium RIFCSPLOWO2_02_FULL_42_19]OGY86368.1 MAG: hypothetical protein A3G01_05220 [Candidatus Kerfeldbacteria bacterium RIFCSPLOWO2_12_FULL_43_9]